MVPTSLQSRKWLAHSFGINEQGFGCSLVVENGRVMGMMAECSGVVAQVIGAGSGGGAMVVPAVVGGKQLQKTQD